MIAFVNAQGSTEVRLACSKVLSLIVHKIFMHDRLYPFFFNVLDEKTLIYRIQDHSSTNAVWGGGPRFEKMSATMVGRRRKF